MPNDTEVIFTVFRSFQTRLGARATMPICSYRSKVAAEQASAAEDKNIGTFLGFRVVTPDGQILDGTLGQFLNNMGLQGIGHMAYGPQQVNDGPSAIIKPSTRIVRAAK